MLVDNAEPSFEAYVQSHIHTLARVAYQLTGDHDLAEDLVQQVLLGMVGRWQRVAEGSNPDGYVRRALYTQHLKWGRQSRRIREVGEETAFERLSPDRSDEIALALAVQDALAKLAPKQREVLVLRYFEDLTAEQVAEALGCSIGTVRSQTRDALARLRALAPELRGQIESEFRAGTGGSRATRRSTRASRSCPTADPSVRRTPRVLSESPRCSAF
ncbi:SigE family RNA polymerase sigma factor [Micromonospora sp. NPDC000668]|uniref:SigE family RNA polymerase sigma factor n=1 Tax=Micromonospora sp. NPDC000668 TaxID=3364219 RepID=UPI0036B21697